MKNILYDSKVGDVVINKKNKKKYIIIGIESDCSAMTMIFYLVRLYNNWCPLIRLVKEVWGNKLKKEYELL